MIHIAQIIVNEHFIKGSTNITTEIHIVDGEDEEECKDKLNNFYNFKDIENYVFYSIEILSINPIIK